MSKNKSLVIIGSVIVAAGLVGSIAYGVQQHHKLTNREALDKQVVMLHAGNTPVAQPTTDESTLTPWGRCQKAAADYMMTDIFHIDHSSTLADMNNPVTGDPNYFWSFNKGTIAEVDGTCILKENGSTTIFTN